jgi:hypothetical protein
MISRRLFLGAVAGLGAAGTAGLSDRADALEEAMSRELEQSVTRIPPPLCQYTRGPGPSPLGAGRLQQGHDPLLPRMPDRPTLMDFFRLRLPNPTHLLQSAKVARDDGQDDETVLACLLHDISVVGLIGSDHGYWAAQMLEPYVPERVSWSIRHHQALRFFPDPDFGYEYPEMYRTFFGDDFQPEPYIVEAERQARKHRWYATSKQICVNDYYAFDPDMKVEIEEFEDVVGRLFRQPEEGLGYDGSPVAHMWRTLIFPTNFL